MIYSVNPCRGEHCSPAFCKNPIKIDTMLHELTQTLHRDSKTDSFITSTGYTDYTDLQNKIQKCGYLHDIRIYFSYLLILGLRNRRRVSVRLAVLVFIIRSLAAQILFINSYLILNRLQLVLRLCCNTNICVSVIIKYS